MSMPEQTEGGIPHNHNDLQDDLPKGTVAPVMSRSASETSSAMDLATPSASPSPEQHEPMDASAGSKRKATPPEGIGTKPCTFLEDNTGNKRQKLEHTLEKAILPAYLWQQVFLYLPPAALGRCLSVCKSFNKYLTNSKQHKSSYLLGEELASESIWIHSRKTSLPLLPRPIDGFTELEMLKLIANKRCQVCRKDPVRLPATTVFNSGPGIDGVRVIWPFGVRVCGTCLEEKTQTDIDVLLSAQSHLRSGLPYAFVTPDKHFIPDVQRNARGGIPSSVRAARVYSKSDIAVIVQEYQEVSSLGEGAAEEWCKGLSARSRSTMADAARWENWEMQARRGSEVWLILREYDPTSFPRSSNQVEPAPFHRTRTPHSSTVAAEIASLPPRPQFSFSGPSPVRSTNGNGAAWPATVPIDVVADRLQRQAEIERRCLELQPPLEYTVLQHVPSFKAALLLSRPFTEQEWVHLEPRILAQRAEAESMAGITRESAPDSSRLAIVGEKKDGSTEANESQMTRAAFLRILRTYAETGMRLYANSRNRKQFAKFAAECVLHVHREYKMQQQKNKAQSNGNSGKAGPGDAASQMPILSLEVMRQTFESHIRKTIPENCWRDLFFCSVCATEKNYKKFGFDSLIQHFAAKHTEAFSKDNIVVLWNAVEWPDEPPFYADPEHLFEVQRKAEKKEKAKSRGAVQEHQTTVVPARVAQDQHSHKPAPAGISRATLVDDQAISMHLASVAKFSSDVHHFWKALDGVKNMLTCIRVQATLNHASQQYSAITGYPVSLDLMTELLVTSDAPEDFKHANGIACKLCVAATTKDSKVQDWYYARIRTQKLFSLSALTNHFQIVHLSQPGSEWLDWRRDMIEVPELSLVGELLNAPGMDDSKLALLAASFPGAFPVPLPTIGQIPEPVETGQDNTLAARMLQRVGGKKKRKLGKKALKAGLAPKEDDRRPVIQQAAEYDPHRPHMTDEPMDVDNDDDARFDTDLARKSAPGSEHNSRPSSHRGNLGESDRNEQQAHPLQSSRPASGTGRGGLSVVRGQDRGSHQAPNPVPNIADILASLTRNANRMVPQGANFSEASTVPQIHAGYDSSLQSLSQHNPSREIEAVLTRTTQDYEQSHRSGNIYYSAQQQGQPSHSYRGASTDMHHFQGPSNQIYQNHPYPPQPGYEPSIQHHGYAPNIRPVYVDQYGRPVEVIHVVDSAAQIGSSSLPTKMQYRTVAGDGRIHIDEHRSASRDPQQVRYEHHHPYNPTAYGLGSRQAYEREASHYTGANVNSFNDLQTRTIRTMAPSYASHTTTIPHVPPPYYVQTVPQMVNYNNAYQTLPPGTRDPRTL